MCGICGIFNYGGVAIDGPERLVGRMSEALTHRGPDDHGLWSSAGKGIYLGHRRLSILDLSARGHQPMLSRSGSVIAYNGEIYNYLDLRDAMADHPFLSTSDTEVLLELYDREGKKCLDRLNGMFAFAVWDDREEQLFLARDGAGEKPLYYTTLGGIFAFASEVKALLTLPWVSRRLDEQALYEFLTFNRLRPPRTMFDGIHKLEAGHFMVVGSGGIAARESWWEVSYRDPELCRDGDAERAVREGIEGSVARRMVSDVPVGAYLSGGVDSSAVVACMSQCTERSVRTYTVGFENAPGYNELEEARRVAELFGTEHTEKIVSAEEIRDFLPRVVDIYCEPLADATSIPIYFISSLARAQGTPVILTGDGADELFAGYRRWARYARWYPRYRAWMALPGFLRRAADSLWGAFESHGPARELLARAARGEEFFQGAGGFREAGKREVLTKAFREKVAHDESGGFVQRQRMLFEKLKPEGRDRDGIDWMCFLGFKDAVPNYYLHRADRMGMAHSVELRAPFLEKDYILLALSLGGGMKLRDGEPKHILKKALEPLLPPDVLYRKKKGFNVPLQQWAGPIMLDHLSQSIPAFCRETGIFDEEGLKRQVERTRGGRGDHIFSLWNIYFLTCWFQRWML